MNRMPTKKANPPADIGAGQWLTTREAATLLGVSYRCLTNWRQNNQGPTHYRFGNKIVHYKAADVQSWIEAHKEKETK